MLEAKNLRKAYGDVVAVDGLSFVARPGEIFGLIGPNGAGKTTSIRMAMNIIAPDSGEILIGGHRLTEEDKAKIGYLPEERGLYRKAKVEEMLLYLASLKGMTETAARKSIGLWLERFGLGEWKGRKIDELSKGMAQKVQFIGTVLHDPELVLFDEPFSGLDPLSQDALLTAMLELRARGATVLFSTHIMEHAEKICERILLVDKGKEVVTGSLAEVKSRYGRNAVQIEFDGDASFVSGLGFVENATAYPRWIEVELKPGADPDDLFRAVAGRLRVRRFEVVAPSLHKIFIRLVGGGTGEAENE
ncbi:MAG: ATP-binding cassette domain-containing protein [Spirochaetaceae bacterium]|nr:ATP-binding cassette domain-containing protein [Spirochaetaceae bacterium]